MRPLSLFVMATALTLLLGACSRPRPKSLSDVSEQLSQQFRSQHEANSGASSRKLKSVRIVSFGFPTGNPHPYLGVAVAWDDATTYTSLPMVQLGDGLFGVTYQDAATKEELSAIISFR